MNAITIRECLDPLTLKNGSTQPQIIRVRILGKKAKEPKETKDGIMKHA